MKRHDGNSGDATTAHGLARPVVRGGHRIVRRKSNGGQAMVELALVVPFAFFLIVLVMNFGGLINAWISVANAARTAADYAILSGSSAGLPTIATSTTLQNLINADMATLPNLSSSNPTACVRWNDNGTLTIIMEMPSGACATYTSPPSDGEAIAAGNPSTYINLAVDVTYTYTPFFVSSMFINYALPNIPTSVHRRAVMRIL
jgi:Flp pilus assembly protein TadG